MFSVSNAGPVPLTGLGAGITLGEMILEMVSASSWREERLRARTAWLQRQYWRRLAHTIHRRTGQY